MMNNDSVRRKHVNCSLAWKRSSSSFIPHATQRRPILHSTQYIVSRTIKLPLIGCSENDENLALIGLPQPDDLALQVEVLGAIVSGRSILQSNLKPLTTQKMKKLLLLSDNCLPETFSPYCLSLHCKTQTQGQMLPGQMPSHRQCPTRNKIECSERHHVLLIWWLAYPY